MDTLERLKTLIALARVDGLLGDKEKQYIISIGQANHLLVAEILPLFTPESLPERDLRQTRNKEEVLLELVQLMHVDEKIYQAEMRFCAKVAARLGFQEAAVFEVMMRAKELAGDWDALKETLFQYQKD